MSSSDKLSFEDTKRLLDHACSASPNMTAAKIADFLEEPPSRISEGRSKGWRLSIHGANKLIEQYGRPKGKPGLFVRAESRETISSFIDSESVVSKCRHMDRISSLYHSGDFRNALADQLKFTGDEYWLLPDSEVVVEKSDRSLSSFDLDDARRASAKNRDRSFEYREKKLAKLFLMMETEAFSQWLLAARSYLEKLRHSCGDPEQIYSMLSSTDYYGINEIHKITPDGKNDHLSSEGSLNELIKEHGLDLTLFPKMSLFLIGSLEHHFRKSKLLHIKDQLTIQAEETLVEMKEYVITGEKIWSHEDRFTEPKLGLAGLESLFFPDIKDRPDWTYPLLLSNNRLNRRLKKMKTHSLSTDGQLMRFHYFSKRTAITH